MNHKFKSSITPVERIRMILQKHIVRTQHPDGWDKSDFFCIESHKAITEVMKFYPELSAELIWGCIGRHLTILNGTLTDFLGGKTAMARELAKHVTSQNPNKKKLI